MTTTTMLRRELTRLRAILTPTRPADPRAGLLRDLRADPARILARAGVAPDPWQAATLRSPAARTLLLCSRQSGKSTVAGALALREAMLTPGSLVLLLSPRFGRAANCTGRR